MGGRNNKLPRQKSVRQTKKLPKKNLAAGQKKHFRCTIYDQAKKALNNRNTEEIKCLH